MFWKSWLSDHYKSLYERTAQERDWHRAEHLATLREVMNANKGIRRLRRKLDKLKGEGSDG